MAAKILLAAYLDILSKSPMSSEKNLLWGEGPGIRCEAHSGLDSDGHISLDREERSNTPQKEKSQVT